MKSVTINILILCAVFVFSASLLAATEADPAQKNKVVAALKRDYPGIDAKSVTLKTFADAHLQKVFGQARFYQVAIYVSLPPKQVAVAEVDQKIIQLPHDFNHLTTMAGIKLTPNNALDVAYAFCQFADPDAIPHMQLNSATAKTQQINAAVVTVQFSTYSRLGGIVKNWEFTFNWNQLSKAIETVSQKDQGNYIKPPEEYKSYHRSLGIPKIHLPLRYQPASKPEQGQLVPKVDVDKNYVTIRENGLPTSQAERTVNIAVSGFDANTEVTIKATSFGGTDGDFLNVKVTTDGNGEKTYAWVASGDASQASDLADVSASGKSGNMVMKINLPASTEGPFALQDKFYNPDQFNVDPDLALTIYYCTGYENYIGSTADAFKNSVRAAMVASYVKQVTDWKFLRPVDQDQNYHVYIDDGTNEFHDSNSTAARAGTERMMWVQADIYSIFTSYSSAQALINVAVAHEFFHGLQYGYHRNLRAMWSPDDGDWIIEGQARFIQTVQYESEEFANTQNLYPQNANLYLQNSLNHSLKANNYNYCIYWRFLYENYHSSNTEADKMAILARALTEADKQEANGQDAVVGGEQAMNDALSGGGGVFNTFDASIDDFAKANYILKLDDADPRQRYDHVATYSDPAIAPPIVYGGTTEEITGDIPVSFGMDFIEVSFTAPSNAATFSFDGGTGDKFATNDNDDFHVTLLVIDNNRLVEEKTLPLDGASEEGQLELTGIGNDANDKVVVVVTRLDSKENDANATGNYKLKVAPSVDIALVIDRSGSMAGQKIIDAKNSARTFVGFMQTGDKVGVISFATSASANFPLTTIVAEATKTTAQNAINGISATGSTAIGAGMQLGQSELNKGDPNHPHAMLLLSDGQENVPPYVADVLPTIPQETDIYTIGLGSDADGQLLSNVAGVTGGEYNFAPSSAKLQEIYQRIQSKITKQQTLTSYTGTISQGNTLTHPVTLDALISRAIFSLTFQGSDVDLEIVTPSGKIIDPQVAAADPNIDYTEGTTFDFYTVLSPEAGSWTLRIKGVDVPTPESYFTTVQVSSQLKMDVALDKNEYSAGEPILISANLKENAQAITGASVSAEITVPTTSMYRYQQARGSFKHAEDAEKNNLDNVFESNNSSSSTEALQFVAETITLFDDGNHNDGVANDGVYSNYFRNTVKDGSYTFTVHASGTALQAGAFMRETAFSTFVKPSTNPFVIGVQPDNGQAGQTLNITITGANFANGATVSFSGTGIKVNSTSFVSATQLNANISIAANASLGPRDVIVQNPNGQSGTGSGLFNILQSTTPCTSTFSDDFENGTDNWLALTPTSWGINSFGGNQAFCLSVPNGVRDEYAVQRGAPWLNFDLTLKAKSDASSNKNFFIIFGTTDFNNATSNGYYLQFALGTVKLYRTIAGGSGSPIVAVNRDYVSDNLFHTIRIERTLPNIKVSVDGAVIIEVNDGAFAIGSIGFGSFNSQACFDSVTISGTRGDASYYLDAFDDGNADGWQPLNPSRWQVGNEGGSLRYFINTTNYEPPASTRLGELAVLANKTWGDFVFECYAQSPDAAAQNSAADVCLVFGYQDFDSYYYANFNSNAGLTQLFRTHNGTNVLLDTHSPSTFTDGDAAYHALRVARTGSEIHVFFDGEEVLTANDSFFGAGLVGIGSYNDAAYFDNIAVTKACETTPVVPSNLTATAFSFSPASASPGNVINLSGTVTNNGAAATGANVKINFFLSTDPNAPNNNLILHSFFMNALAAGQSSSFNEIGTVPANTGAGLYYVWISIDPDNTIAENNETDNLLHANSQLTVSPGGCTLAWQTDLTVRDAGNNTATLSIGQGASATNDIDVACGEAELPPSPPSGIFDARLELPISPAKASLKDYRNNSQQAVNWRVKFQPGVNGPMIFSWNSAAFPAGCFLLKDEITGTLVNIDMKTQSTYSLTNLAITSLKIEYNGSVPSCVTCRDVSVAAGWNIVSIPVLVSNMAVGTLFPDAPSQAFAFNNGYTNATTLTTGKGYWIKFNSAKTYTNLCGALVNPKRIPVVAGWNIIGPFETDIPVANLTSSPANIITSSYFGYNNGYTQATTLSVGKGYWVKASVAGDLILPGSAMTKQTAETQAALIAPQSEVNAAWPTLVIADSRGNSGRIYLAPAAEINANFEMPPTPPSGIFDVRFSTGLYVENLESGALEIQINSAYYPIRIKGQNLGDRTLTVKDALGGTTLHEALTSGRELLISKAVDKIVVEAAIRLPSRYALSQNYPNPFNPTTMIRLALPEKSHVKLTMYNIVGERVAELVNQELPAGYHQVEFNGKNFASGIYFYVMESGSFRDLKKLIISK